LPCRNSRRRRVAASDTRPYVALATNAGTIVIRLEDKRAPVTTANFLRYVDSKRMDGFTFYRTTRSWGPDSRLVQAGNRGDPRKNYPPIAHEPTTLTGLTHCKGRDRDGPAGPRRRDDRFLPVAVGHPGLRRRSEAAGR
jgi:hypothetical protein